MTEKPFITFAFKVIISIKVRDSFLMIINSFIAYEKINCNSKAFVTKAFIKRRIFSFLLLHEFSLN